MTCKRISNKKTVERNKEKYYARAREWHRNNKERVSLSHKKSYEKIRKIIIEAKSKPCEDCGVHYPYYVMDFDHFDGEKLLNVGLSRSIKRTIAEIEKCQVVCANCHRERTYGKRKQ